MGTFVQPEGFDWDVGNRDKNWLKHKVAMEECEEVFFDTNKKLFKDILHSMNEPRFVLVGKTQQHRILLILFTIRNNRVRVISARDSNKKERKFYEKKY